MKISKRLLALLLSVAMLVGMVAIGANAGVTDYGNYDYTTNPYTAKLGVKVSKVDPETGVVTPVTDNQVSSGDLLRIETWIQTNYYIQTTGVQVAYTNDYLIPTLNTANGYAAYTFLGNDTAVTAAKVFESPTKPEEIGEGDGSWENPYWNPEIVVLTGGWADVKVSTNYGGAKNNYPKAWVGTGTTASNWILPEYANYNCIRSGFAIDSTASVIGYGNAAIMNVYQPYYYFYLTVADDVAANSTANIQIPAASARNTAATTGQTYITRVPNADDPDSTTQSFYGNGVTGVPFMDTYGEDTDTKYDRVYDLTDANITLTINGGTTPPAAVDKAALQAAITDAGTKTAATYTPASWSAMQAKLTAANAVNGDADATQDEVNAAKDALTAAITALVTRADNSALTALIATAQGKNQNDYTTDSWSAAGLAAAIAAAQTVANNGDATATDITNAISALQAKLDLLVAKANKAALQAAIADAGTKTAATYTPASWSAMQAKLTAANTVNADDNATQDEVNAAKDALTVAIAALVNRADNSALTALIATAQGKNQNDYTPASWTAADLAAAIAAAQTVANNADATAAEITNAISALQAKLDLLVAKANKAALQAAIADAGTKTAADYTPASWSAMQAKLTAANAVNADDDATQDEVNAAKDALTAAIAALDLRADNSALTALIATAQGKNQNDYTPNSWTAAGLAAAITAAQSVADNANATAADITNAVSALQAKLDLLVAKADKVALQAAYTSAAALSDANYTPSSWAEASLSTVLPAALAVINDENATQADVNAQKANIDAAVAKLETKVNKAALLVAINAANALDEDDYTPASWTLADIAAVVSAAQLVYNDGDATAQNVSDAIASINTASAKLVEKAGKSYLLAAINTTVTFTEDTATTASWNNYTDALADANSVYNDANATQSAVDSAKTTLLAAIEALAARPACDYSDLDDAIAAYNALVQANYTPTSWSDSDVEMMYEEAAAISRNMLADDEGNNQQSIEDATDNLNNAINELVLKANKVALKASIDALPTVAQANATTASWAAYTNALAEANTVYADDDATQEEVNTAKSNLDTAKANVTALGGCNYDALDAAITAYEALTLADYTPESVTASDVTDKYDAAKAVARNLENDEDGNNQAAINAAATALNAAIAALDEKADKSDLETAIGTLPAVAQGNATTASWTAYANALAAANVVKADDNATQEEVNNATTALNTAITGVEQLPYCDYSELAAAKNSYTALVEADYTPNSWTASDVEAKYADALAVAENMLDNESGTNQVIINNAAAALNAAIAALVEKADKAALASAIAAAPSLTEDYATDASWANYTAKLADANTVNGDPNATQAAVNAAEAALVAAKTLVARDLCDYTALNAALALTPAEAQSAYTSNSWNAYATAKAAAQAIAPSQINNKSGSNQAAINAAATALTNAFNALNISTANVTDCIVDLGDYYAVGTRTYQFKVNGGASKIRVISPNGSTTTFDRYSPRVNVVSYDSQGNVVDYETTAPAYELWTTNLLLAEGTYEVVAKYGTVWDAQKFDFSVALATYVPEVTFTAKATGSEDALSKTLTVLRSGRSATFQVIAPNDVLKVQLVFPNGATSTYTSAKAVAGENDTIVWTINRNVTTGDAGNVVLKVKTVTGGWSVADTDVVVLSFIG